MEFFFLVQKSTTFHVRQKTISDMKAEKLDEMEKRSFPRFRFFVHEMITDMKQWPRFVGVSTRIFSYL